MALQHQQRCVGLGVCTASKAGGASLAMTPPSFPPNCHLRTLLAMTPSSPSPYCHLRPLFPLPLDPPACPDTDTRAAACWQV